MTHLSVRVAALVAATILAHASGAAVGRAQCATCPTPVVAFSPVVAAPTTFVAPATVVVQPRLGLFDRWRLRRWGVAMPVVAAPVVAAPVATTQFAAMPVVSGQTWTAGFAPAVTAVPAHVTAFAPLQRQVVQTTLMPVSTVDSCAPCAAATTVLRPVSWTPVVQQSACTTCASMATPCDACASGATSSVVEQASFAAPASGCASCGVAAEPYYGTPAQAGEPETPTPALDAEAPVGTGYPPENGSVIDPAPVDENDPAAFTAPPLIGPDLNGNTASRPSVDVHTALYRHESKTSTVSATTQRTHPTSPRRAADAGGWTTSAATR